MHSPAHTATFTVTGMSCGHCERAIRTELSSLSGLEIVALSADQGQLTVASSAAFDPLAIVNAVAEAGYEATLTTVS